MRRDSPDKPNDPPAVFYLATVPTPRLAEGCVVLAVVVKHVVPRVDPVALPSSHSGDSHGILLGGRAIVVIGDDFEVGLGAYKFFHTDLRGRVRVQPIANHTITSVNAVVPDIYALVAQLIQRPGDLVSSFKVRGGTPVLGGNLNLAVNFSFPQTPQLYSPDHLVELHGLGVGTG